MTRGVHSTALTPPGGALGARGLHTGQGVVERLEIAVSEGFVGGSQAGIAWTPATGIGRPDSGEIRSGGTGRDESVATNVFGRRLLRVSGLDGSGGYAATPGFAAGLARSGLRAATLLEARAFSNLGRDLADAARHWLPLVVHVAGGSGSTPTAGAEGLFQLASANPQEAADLTLIAHRVAELALLPGLHLLGGSGVAETLAPVVLPDAETLRTYLGDPDDEVLCPTPAQALLFGRRRRRVPGWFSLDSPGLQGADRQAWERALEGAAAGPFFLEHLPELIQKAMAEFQALTGRSHAPVCGTGMEDADHVVVAAGSAAGLVEAVAGHLRNQGRARVGVLRITQLAPFPRAQVARHLAGKRAVCVLEGGARSVSGTGALGAAVETVFGASANTASGKAVDNAFGLSRGPAMITARFGDVVAPEDVAALIDHLTGKARTVDASSAAGASRATTPESRASGGRVFLGIQFPRTGQDALPKREILAQHVERDYPDLAQRTIRDQGQGQGQGQVSDLRPDGALTITIRTAKPRQAYPAVEEECAAFLEAITGQTATGRPMDPRAERCTAYRIALGYPAAPGHDRELLLGSNRDDVIVIHGLTALSRSSALTTLREQGVLILIASGDLLTIWSALPASVRETIRRKRLQVHVLDPTPLSPAPSASPPPGPPEINLGRLLQGALVAGVVRPGWPGWSKQSGRPTWNEDRAFTRLAAETGIAPDKLAFLREAADQVGPLPWAELEARAPIDARDPTEIPLALRRIRDGGPPYSRLSRFWSETAPDYLADPPVQPTADPFRAVDFLPPATATFSDRTGGRSEIPRFVPDNCTGCGLCLAWCPHSALNAVVVGPEPLLQAGLELAGKAGVPLTQLMPAIRPLAQILARHLKKRQKGEGEPSADALLPLAFEGWAEQKKLANDSLDEARGEFDRLTRALGCFPLAITDTFFRTPESQHKGSGELFSLVVDPLACTGCLACVNACPEDALEPTQDTPEVTGQLQARFRTWERLPDTRAETVQRVAMDPGYGPIRAHLLSRSFALTIGGADAAAPGSGERLVLRWIASTVESLVQPRVRQLAAEVTDLVDRLGEQVQGLFGNALPVGELDTVVRGLAGDGDRPLRLEDLVDRLGEAARTRPVDSGRLKRLVELIQSLRELTWVLTEGPSGLGRARLGLVATGGSLGFGRVSPLNPFSFPVLVQDGDGGVDVAAGLCRGHLRHMLDNIRLVRRARLEATGRYDPRQHDAEIAALDVADLTEEEWGALPPLVLVGDERILHGRGRECLAALLDGDVPVKVLLVCRGEAGTGRPGRASPGKMLDAIFFALTHRRAFVLGTSIANSGHLAEGLTKALRSRRPAFIQVYAPPPAGEGRRADGSQVDARLALLARATPCLRFDPDTDGVFGLRLSLAGNPEPEADFARHTIVLRDGEKPESIDAAITLADWASGQSRFDHHFSVLTTEIGGIALDEYLLLPPGDRGNRTPFIQHVDDEGRLVRYRVSERMVRASEQTLEAWRVLQEWAGLVSPFTDVLRRRLQDELANEHQAALDAQKNHYEEKLRLLAENHHAETVTRLRDRLVQLSGHGKPPDGETAIPTPPVAPGQSEGEETR